MDPIRLGNLNIDGTAPILIAGPCVIEDADLALSVARRIASFAITSRYRFVFKASYTKDNRSSGGSFRGVGIEEGLRILDNVRREVGCPVLSDVHSVTEVEMAAEVLDVVQIPAFLSRQTSLLEAAGRCGKAVNIKKGQFLSPHGMGMAVDKVRDAGGRDLLVTERGTTFGYGDLVVDFRSFVHMREFGFPVIFDVTHSLQKPAGLGDRSGGEPALAAAMARAAVAIGVDGVFIEAHPDPSRALSDGASMLPLDRLEGLLEMVYPFYELTHRTP